MAALATLSCLLCIAACSPARAEGDSIPVQFARIKAAQADDLASRLHLEMPADANAFFEAAKDGDTASVSKLYQQLRRTTGQQGSLCLPATNALAVPLHETMGACSEYELWDGPLMRKYADAVLQSMPAGSVYFGGTDAGRFVITAFRDVANEPDIFVLTPKFLLPQDGRPIGGYLDYLQAVYGDRLTLPAEADVQAAIDAYARDIRSGRATGGVATNDGVTRVQGPIAIMGVNGMLSRWIFDHNRGQHAFYYEESYVTPWMYPYLEPHGLIMKLNREPLAEFDASVVARDRAYWGALVQELVADPAFIENSNARRVFAKLRSGIGGLYQFRGLTDEAEVAFKQSVTLAPDLSEGVLRLADLYLRLRRFDDAEAAVKEYEGQLDPGPFRNRISDFLAQIRKQKDDAKGAADP